MSTNVTPTLRVVNPAVQELAVEDTCTACGYALAAHYRLSGSTKRFTGCPTPPLTDGSLRAAIVGHDADQANALAGVIAVLTSPVPFEQMADDERQRRIRQAARTLREFNGSAEKVARYRASTACAKQMEVLLYGNRRALSPTERQIAKLIAEATVNAYQMSLEGLADDRQPAIDDEIAERLPTGPAHCPDCKRPWREHDLGGCKGGA